LKELKACENRLLILDPPPQITASDYSDCIITSIFLKILQNNINTGNRMSVLSVIGFKLNSEKDQRQTIRKQNT
jgi:hypothetical protein